MLVCLSGFMVFLSVGGGVCVGGSPLSARDVCWAGVIGRETGDLGGYLQPLCAGVFCLTLCVGLPLFRE